MAISHKERLGFSGIGVAAICLLFGGWAAGQDSAPAVIALGEVTANDVYVRSGPSMNYYPVCKLPAGHRVRILSEREAWYEIDPPAGTFSLIHEDYVDTVDGKRGVVNGNNVLVRAGSSLPEWSKQKYARQAKLSKGAGVTILGKSPEGYLRISPPTGVTAWIHRTLVHPVPNDLVEREQQARAPGSAGEEAIEPVAEMSSGTAKTAMKVEPDPEASDSSAAAAQAPILAALPPTKERKTLLEIDEAIKAELKRPVLERDFAPFRQRYEQIAAGEGDELARDYAKARLDQLAHMAALIDAVKKMRRLDEQTEAQRVKFMEERANQRYTPLAPVQAGLDAQGELRTSALYPPGSQPRRFRLVDPSSSRTIGYVELPSDSTLDVDSYVGRYVGVRASEKRLLAGGVNPVPIYVVRELTLLRPSAGSEGPS